MSGKTSSRDLAPKRHKANDPALKEVLALIQASFAYMDGRIDPPSSMLALSVETISEHCTSGEVWSLSTPPQACVFFTPESDCLYLGKVAVKQNMRGQGLARQLIELAETRAISLKLPCLELKTRIELVENHQTFSSLGFTKVSEDSHSGYSQPTYITMRKNIK